MRRRLFLGLAATGVLTPAVAQAEATGRTGWAGTWTSMPQLCEPHNMPPPPFTQDGLVLADATLRQTVRVTVGGRRMRLRFSNAFGGAVLPITAVTVALPKDGRAGVSAIQPSTVRRVTFNGRSSVDVPKGALMVSDPLDFPLKPGMNLTVTAYLARGQASNDITSHPGSRTTSHLLAGNHVESADLVGSTPTDHWYFLSGIEVLSTASAVVMIGDSLTDGRGSTTNGNDRWPDQLLNRMPPGVAVLNQAAGGNRVLNDGLGPSVLARLDRDLLAQSAVRWSILFEGVNDIGTAATTEAAQKQVADDLIAGYQQIVDRAHARDIKVYGATLTPFGASFYDEGFREETRQTVNRWIRTSRRFDAVVDFDAAVRDPANPRQLVAAADVGDHLHLNPTGYRMLAEAVPLRLFR
ncbi:lysophospholipase L1-like esterase [Lentzea atacamensis]|uniref:Lysophospholipase L1-like esterase n=1 Tax=Lentzea atacamensis TaxID=531938 RepID=A0A316HUQ9_9PSEU|nr:SGNH/GDSL hydrolase family protein [Lentzea atacamensis]PWK83810.1 lysophospholipase L1-like esterase [Lentzea atacamensis]